MYCSNSLIFTNVYIPYENKICIKHSDRARDGILIFFSFINIPDFAPFACRATGRVKKKNSNNWRTDGESMVRPVCVCVYCVCVLMKNAFVPLFYQNINEIGRMANANGILMCYSCITHAQFFAEWVNEPAVWLLSVHATINKIDIRSSNNGKKWILKTTRVSEWVSTCAIWYVIKCVVEPSSSAIFAWAAAFIY